MRTHDILKRIVKIGVCLSFSAFIATVSYAGQWIADTTGYWYVHNDGSYPTYSWEWIDVDGDGIYKCYAFDEKGYLYINTITPDGYAVGADGAWYSNSVPMTRAFINNATIAPTSIGVNNTTDYAYTSDGIQLVTNKYSNAKNKKTTGSSSSSSSSNKSSSSSKSTKSGTTIISNNVSSADIVTSKLVTGKSTTTDSNSTDSEDNSSTTQTTKTSSEPDVSKTSYDTNGPGANIPSNYSAQTISPTTDPDSLKEVSPGSGAVIERDGGSDDEDEEDIEDDE